jgi:signal transduction histidine kinase
MMDIDDLRPLFIFDGLNDAQLAELLAASDEVRFAEGDEVFREGDPADHWWVLVEGRVDLRRRTGRDETVLGAMERPGVWAGGFRAWDDEGTYLATGRAATDGWYLRVPAAALSELTRKWFPFSVHLIGGFFQTVRRMDALSRQRGALIALGGLAAGLAHEINNPASATMRAIDALQETSDTLLSSLTQLADRSLPPECFAAIDQLRREIEPSTERVDALTLADREDALNDWLDDHGVGAAWRIAPALASVGVDVAWCERAAAALEGGALEPGLEWVAATLTTRSLLGDAKGAMTRIADLVDAVKSYSQLDRPSMQRVDVAQGIESTLVMLHHRMGDDIVVIREYGDDVPEIDAIPGALNQVWTNLIDNAIDAMDGSGTLRIKTCVDAENLIVEIADTGPGMPPDVQARAFEPFFTTKDVGKGTGLGLDISRGIIVQAHGGQIKIDPRPGETVLVVHLPLPAA